ncbi:NAD(+) diphosphatase [Bartonella sp. DGB2]|uniref:NAD(+) diphosphatase n=1 Tax=Bartonella sp. DGB2 TaxID=3388426 RepID=UPI0039902F78
MFGKLAFINNPIIRQFEKRVDFSPVEMREGEPYIIAFYGKNLLYRVGEIPEFYLSAQEVEPFSPQWDEACLLGWQDGRRVVTLFITTLPVVEEKSSYAQLPLWEGYQQKYFYEAEAGAVAQAYSLLTWHRSQKFCGYCGKKMQIKGGGASRQCSHCSSESFPRVDPVAIMLVHDANACLLARSPNFAHKRYSCLAGFIEQGETLEAAVQREVYEEMGVLLGEVTYHFSQPWPFAHSLMLGCSARALSRHITMDPIEIEDGGWFERESVQLMLEGRHPEGLIIAPEGSIARCLIRQWLGS